MSVERSLVILGVLYIEFVVQCNCMIVLQLLSL